MATQFYKRAVLKLTLQNRKKVLGSGNDDPERTIQVEYDSRNCQLRFLSPPDGLYPLELTLINELVQVLKKHRDHFPPHFESAEDHERKE